MTEDGGRKTEVRDKRSDVRSAKGRIRRGEHRLSDLSFSAFQLARVLNKRSL